MLQKEAQIKEERLKKFRAMGIPQPIQSIDPTTIKNANVDPEKLAKLEAIKNGANKEFFMAFLEKSNHMQPSSNMPVPKQQKSPVGSRTAGQVVKSFTPDGPSSSEAAMLEAVLYGDVDIQTHNVKNKGKIDRMSIIAEDVNVDHTGSEFIDQFRSKLRSSIASKVEQAGMQASITVQKPRGLDITEEELERKIVEISTQVAKTVVKKVLVESSKPGSGIIIETNKVRKAELVGDGIVKIDGKMYKLTPLELPKQQQ